MRSVFLLGQSLCLLYLLSSYGQVSSASVVTSSVSSDDPASGTLLQRRRRKEIPVEESEMFVVAPKRKRRGLEHDEEEAILHGSQVQSDRRQVYDEQQRKLLDLIDASPKERKDRSPLRVVWEKAKNPKYSASYVYFPYSRGKPSVYKP